MHLLGSSNGLLGAPFQRGLLLCPSTEVTPKRGVEGDREVYYSVLNQRGLLVGGLRVSLITEGCWSCYQGVSHHSPFLGGVSMPTGAESHCQLAGMPRNLTCRIWLGF